MSTSVTGRPFDPLRGMRQFIRRQRQRMAGEVPTGAARYSPIAPEVLRARYIRSEAARRKDSFVLYRIVGNDLVPRHAKGQSRDNVRFILEHEPPLRECEKRWVLNRISDADEEAKIIALLERHGQPFLRIPFEADGYRRTTWDATGAPFTDLPFSTKLESLDDDTNQRFATHLRRKRNLYAMNNNGARNAAIADGRARAKWILPFDGNCFFTLAAFDALRAQACAEPIYPYLIVPMARVSDNDILLDPAAAPSANQEPQIGFRCDATETFDECRPYGRRPKVELLWRLGVPGEWDHYRFDAWDDRRPPLAAERGAFVTAGWVARLSSGRADLDVGSGSFLNRGIERNRAIVARLDELDRQLVAEAMDPEALVYYDVCAVRALQSANPALADALRTAADRLLADHAFGDRPTAQTSLPYKFSAVATLAVAAVALDVQEYGHRAARFVDAWFINPATRMAYGPDRVTATEVIEFRNLPFLLDAVKLLTKGGFLSVGQVCAFRAWITGYSVWFTGGAGSNARKALDHHGTFYDVQQLALGLFVEDAHLVSEVRNRWPLRLRGQLLPNGQQPHELHEDNPGRCYALNLSGWSILARLLQPIGSSVWSWRDAEGRSLQKAVEALGSGAAGRVRAEGFDRALLVPVLEDYRRNIVDGSLPGLEGVAAPHFDINPDTPLPPCWMLGR